jgi:hypothetical protein
MNELSRNVIMENQVSKDSGEAISVRIPIKPAAEGLITIHLDQHQWNSTQLSISPKGNAIKVGWEIRIQRCAIHVANWATLQGTVVPKTRCKDNSSTWLCKRKKMESSKGNLTVRNPRTPLTITKHSMIFSCAWKWTSTRKHPSK